MKITDADIDRIEETAKKNISDRAYWGPRGIKPCITDKEALALVSRDRAHRAEIKRLNAIIDGSYHGDDNA
jgi:hypothetical protein